MEDKQYDKELKGFLWQETGSTILRKGTLQIKGEELYSAIIKSKNNKGEDKYELMISVGLLHLNTEKMIFLSVFSIRSSGSVISMGNSVCQLFQT